MVPVRDRQLSDWRELYTVHPNVGVVRTNWLLFRFTVELGWWIGLPGKWILQAVRLLLFAVIMLPGFLPVTWQYLTSPCIRKNLTYGKSMRHQCDVYIPCTGSGFGAKLQPVPEGGFPVVLFVSGGAWIIGYKLWGFIMGIVFQLNGVLFVACDYRNFPQARVPEMVDDVQEALLWVRSNVVRFGGDPEDISLVGQSAGAHLTALVMLRQALGEQPGMLGAISSTRQDGEAEAPGGAAGWLRRWVGISGPYEVDAITEELHARGLHRAVVQALMGGDVGRSSPTRVLAGVPAAHWPAVVARLPAVSLFHGTRDKTVSMAQTRRLAELLRGCGARRVFDSYLDGKSHTDPIIEDPLSGVDPLMERLLQLVLHSADRGHSLRDIPATLSNSRTSPVQMQGTSQHGKASRAPDESASSPYTTLPRYVPAPLLWLARLVNPF